MIVKRVISDESKSRELLETSSTDYYKLRQNETGKVYGHIVVDLVLGYKEGDAYGAYTYAETDEKDVPPDPENNA